MGRGPHVTVSGLDRGVGGVAGNRITCCVLSGFGVRSGRETRHMLWSLVSRVGWVVVGDEEICPTLASYLECLMCMHDVPFCTQARP